MDDERDREGLGTIVPEKASSIFPNRQGGGLLQRNTHKSQPEAGRKDEPYADVSGQTVLFEVLPAREAEGDGNVRMQVREAEAAENLQGRAERFTASLCSPAEYVDASPVLVDETRAFRRGFPLYRHGSGEGSVLGGWARKGRNFGNGSREPEGKAVIRLYIDGQRAVFRQIARR